LIEGEINVHCEMIIFELIKQGNRVNQFDDFDKNFELDDLIGHLLKTFFEANVALNLYLEEKRNRLRYLQNERENWDNDRELKYQLRLKIEQEYLENEPFENGDEINFKTETEFKKHIWGEGRVPFDLKSRLIFIHARIFLFAFDNFEKQFKRLLDDELVPKSLGYLHVKLIENFPDLRQLRNSIHHQEDRIRGEKYGKKIDLKPMANEVFNVPGGALVNNCLDGDSYCGTLGDGTFGKVDVSVESMNILQSILQEFLDSLNWEGFKEHLPK